jgi:hypothetical protein
MWSVTITITECNGLVWSIFPFSLLALPVVDRHDKGTSDPEGTLLF